MKILIKKKQFHLDWKSNGFLDDLMHAFHVESADIIVVNILSRMMFFIKNEHVPQTQHSIT